MHSPALPPCYVGSSALHVDSLPPLCRSRLSLMLCRPLLQTVETYLVPKTDANFGGWNTFNTDFAAVYVKMVRLPACAPHLAATHLPARLPACPLHRCRALRPPACLPACVLHPPLLPTAPAKVGAQRGRRLA